MKRVIQGIAGIAVLAAGLALATPASAQDLDVAYQFQHLSGDGDSINYPLGFNVDVAVPFDGNLSIVGQFDWSRKSDSDSAGGVDVSATSTITAFGGGVRWNGAGTTAHPFAQALIGVARSAVDCQVAGVKCSDVITDNSVTDMMLQFGAGVTVPLSSLDALAQVDFRRIFGDTAANSLRFLVGVRIPLR